jgi:pimeloyl-ACP methyl ester carboxylesterase
VTATGERMPVVLVHGALRSRLGLLPTAAILSRFGLDARPFGYPTRRGTVWDHGRALSDFLDGWLGTTRVPVLGFLTHSMGGLVVRAYLEIAGTRHAPAQRVVMLSPPNRGARLAVHHRQGRLARLLYGDALKELHPEVAGRMPLPPASASVLVLAGARGDGRGWNPRLAGDDDGVVALEEMALGDRAPHVVGGVHSMLQWRPEVLRCAATFLVSGEMPV